MTTEELTFAMAKLGRLKTPKALAEAMRELRRLRIEVDLLEAEVGAARRDRHSMRGSEASTSPMPIKTRSDDEPLA